MSWFCQDFEFTATFGFHILGIFPPEKPVREIEYLLLQLRVPPEMLDSGSMTVGASSDVLTAYRLIHDAGGLAIAAHANSANGVAMRGFSFGGQTKIAYTQDPYLDALEVTDLGLGGRRSTAGFFLGTKPEYPRRMHCIQGSDAHRLRTDPENKKIWASATERRKPCYRKSASRLWWSCSGGMISRKRALGARRRKRHSISSSRRETKARASFRAFMSSWSTRGGHRYAIIADVCALANTNGGTLYVGVSADPKQPPDGVPSPQQAVKTMEQEIAKRIYPALEFQVDVQETRGKKVVRILVPRGPEPPYAVDDNKVYIREEAETGLAVRDEIVQLVLRRSASSTPAEAPTEEKRAETPAPEPPLSEDLSPPRTGVEVVGFEERQAVRYYTMRDLRNSNVVKNVTEFVSPPLVALRHHSLPEVAGRSSHGSPMDRRHRLAGGAAQGERTPFRSCTANAPGHSLVLRRDRRRHSR